MILVQTATSLTSLLYSGVTWCVKSITRKLYNQRNASPVTIVLCMKNSTN